MSIEGAEDPPRATALGQRIGADEIERLFEEHHRRVLRAAYRVTGKMADAEDVLQTIFVRLARRESGAPLGDATASYFYRAAVNAALDLLRSRTRSRATSVDDQELERISVTNEGPETDALEVERREALREALGRLNPKAAEMFALRYFEGYTNTEIAEMYGASRTSVAVSLHRTRNRLQKELRRPVT